MLPSLLLRFSVACSGTSPCKPKKVQITPASFPIGCGNIITRLLAQMVPFQKGAKCLW